MKAFRELRGAQQQRGTVANTRVYTSRTSHDGRTFLMQGKYTQLAVVAGLNAVQFLEICLRKSSESCQEEEGMQTC